MSGLQHPLLFLKKEWVDTIKQYAAMAEADGRFHERQMALMYEQQWFKLLAPACYGGLQWSLPQALQLEEAVSCADGSMGWVLTLCAGAGWFGGFLEPSLAEKIFTDPQVCVAGSGGVTGAAEITDNGYIINGKWLHASGAPDATVFTANCSITQNGIELKNNDGSPSVLSFAFLRDEVRVVHTWNSMGMVATASHAFEVNDLYVPEERAFKIDSAAARVNESLYYYPFLQLAETTLAVNLSGMGIHFMDLCEETFIHKKNCKGFSTIKADEMFAALDSAKQQMAHARADMYAAANQSWQQCTEKHIVSEEILMVVSQTSNHLATTARQCVDMLYPYCGLYAADKTTEINRVWRDMHTASQHALLAFKSLRP